ncbi:MAG: DUF1259 domain-containing protein [Chitinispirillaceae bacterium]|jgi:hypothetical protein
MEGRPSVKMFFSTIFVVCFSVVTYSKEAKLDTALIQSLSGCKGTWNAKEGIFKVTSPRNDVSISVDGFVMPPFMGLTSWAAFSDEGKSKAMVMGDLVLFQDEVNPVMSALLDNGLQVTALHNHFFYDDPKVFFMHITADDSLTILARGVGKAFETIKDIRKSHPKISLGFEGQKISGPSNITAKTIESIFDIPSDKKDGMVKVSIGRMTRMPCGCEAGNGMGVNTWAAFAGTDENALVDGDFAVKEAELRNVLKSLRSSSINIVAIHSHMIQEEPRILFLHYWGKGNASELAKAVKAALNFTKTDSQK